MKTLKDISFLHNIPVPTLKTRIESKNIGLIEGEDFRRMGKGQVILFSPEGVAKITKDADKILNKELIKRNKIYMLYKVTTVNEVKYEFFANKDLYLTNHDSLEDTLKVWEYFKESGTIII